MALEVRIRKKLNDFLLDVAFSTKDNALCLLGEQGSGKTMALRCIAGLETPDEGRIVLDGRVLYDSIEKINVPSAQRKIGYLSGDTALFAGLTVEENIRLALVASGEVGEKGEKNRNELSVLTASCLKAYGLDGLGGEKPQVLSGAQQVLAAFARMMAAKPRLILLDEPFRAVESYQKAEILRKIRENLEKDRSLEAVFAGADRDEAFSMGEEILVLHAGRSQRARRRADFFENPETITGAILSGCENITRIRRLDAYHAISSEWGSIFCFRRRRRILLADKTWEKEEATQEEGGQQEAAARMEMKPAEQKSADQKSADHKPAAFLILLKTFADKTGAQKEEAPGDEGKKEAEESGAEAEKKEATEKEKEKRGRGSRNKKGKAAGRKPKKKEKEEPKLTPEDRWLRLPDDMAAVGVRAGDFMTEPPEPRAIRMTEDPKKEKKAAASGKAAAEAEEQDSAAGSREERIREEENRYEAQEEPAAGKPGTEEAGEVQMQTPAFVTFALHDTRIEEEYDRWNVYFRPSLRSDTELVWSVPKREIRREEILKVRKLYVLERKILWLME